MPENFALPPLPTALLAGLRMAKFTTPTLKWITELLGKTFIKNALMAAGGVVVGYMLVDLVLTLGFKAQSAEDGAYWSHARDVRSAYGWMQFAGYLTGTLLLTGGLILSVAYPEFAWAFGGIAAGATAAMCMLMPHVTHFIHREERDLGYPLS